MSSILYSVIISWFVTIVFVAFMGSTHSYHELRDKLGLSMIEEFFVIFMLVTPIVFYRRINNGEKR